MKSLSPRERKNGFDYNLVIREGNVAIYRQEVSEKTKYYEVFKVKTRPERTYKGVIREAHEIFPRNNDFGLTAWSCRTLDEAKEIFNHLIKNHG